MLFVYVPEQLGLVLSSHQAGAVRQLVGRYLVMHRLTCFAPVSFRPTHSLLLDNRRGKSKHMDAGTKTDSQRSLSVFRIDLCTPDDGSV